jgi:pimeloyl-ACP methyl ester carboxylesterase
MPVLIVWGARDPFVPVSQAEQAHRAIPGSRLVILEGVSHYPHCEVPDRFVDVVVDFVDSTEPARLPVRSTPRALRPSPPAPR